MPFRRPRLLVLLALWGFLLQAGSGVAVARIISADISCDQLAKLGDDAGLIMYWLPGWWGALRGDPHVNAYRVTYMTNAIAEACHKHSKARLLGVARGIPSMPPVPDDGIRYQCRDFMSAGEAWQALYLFWLQGYHAYLNGNTELDTDFFRLRDAFTRMCKSDKTLTMNDIADVILKTYK